MNSLWTVSYIVLWVIVAGLVVLMMGLLRQLGLIQLRLGIEPGVLITNEGLERGTKAPDFEAVDVATKRPLQLSQFRGKRLVLVFLTPSCLACRDLVPHLNQVAHDYQGKIEMLAVCYGAGSTCAEFAGRFKLRITCLADQTNTVAGLYRISATLFAFLIDESGTIRIRGVVNSWPQLEALLSEEGTVQGERAWQPLTNQPSPANGNGSKDTGNLTLQRLESDRSAAHLDP